MRRQLILVLILTFMAATIWYYFFQTISNTRVGTDVISFFYKNNSEMGDKLTLDKAITTTTIKEPELKSVDGTQDKREDESNQYYSEAENAIHKESDEMEACCDEEQLFEIEEVQPEFEEDYSVEDDFALDYQEALADLADFHEAIRIKQGDERLIESTPSTPNPNHLYWNQDNELESYHVYRKSGITVKGDLAVLDASDGDNIFNYKEKWDATVASNRVSIYPAKHIQPAFDITKDPEDPFNKSVRIQLNIYVSPDTPPGLYYVTAHLDFESIKYGYSAYSRKFTDYIYVW